MNWDLLFGLLFYSSFTNQYSTFFHPLAGEIANIPKVEKTDLYNPNLKVGDRNR